MQAARAKPVGLDVFLFPFPRAALAVAATDGYLPVASRLRHVHPQQKRGSRFENVARCARGNSQGVENSGRHGAGQRRRHGVADLPAAVPFGRMEPEPVGEAVQARHFPNGDAARPLVRAGDW